MSVSKGNKGYNNGFLTLLKAYLGRNRLGELLVIKGLITPKDLRVALHTQKKTNQPLGQIFLKHSLISKKQLALLLGRQMALRALASTIFFLSVTGTKARADIMDVPARIAISAPSMSQEFTAVSSYPGLFGTDEKRSKNLKPFTKWTSMFSRFDRELNNKSTDHLIRNWQNNLSNFKGQSLKKMANSVNNLMNERRYIGDKKNWGRSDYWATPVEFLKRGGDCEDFAIAKYAALRALGVPEERLRIAIVHDTVKNIPHAILVVYTNEGTFILDNQIKKLVRADNAGRYRPIFSINRTAWWLHTVPTTNVTTIIASSQ